jgi:glycerol-1-phosphatase
MGNEMSPSAGTAPAADAATAALLEPGQRSPAADYDVALLDLDGVVYSGPEAIPGAVRAVAAAREAGLRIAFVTNNASRSPSAVAEQLTRLGVTARSADVITSAQAAATLIANRFPPGSRVLVAGAIALRLALRERGLRPVSVASDRPVAVVQGFVPDMSYGLLAEAGVAVRDGAYFVATNTDSTLPTPRGPQPGNGSLVQVIVTATGQHPAVAGKPETPLHAEAIARTGAKHPLVVGDRLDTDIEGAVRGGADSMLVLTGVSTPEDAVLAPASRRPTYLAADLGGLLDPQPAVGPRGRGGMAARDDDASDGPGPSLFRCGGWEARRAEGPGPIELDGDGAWINGLRALCAAAWSGEQVTPDLVEPALKALGQPGR